MLHNQKLFVFVNAMVLAAALNQDQSGTYMFKNHDKPLQRCYMDDDNETFNSTALNEALHCPRTYDGITCWNATLASTTAYQNCPSTVSGFDERRLAHKTCTENGTWFIHPDTGKPWTNYTDCIDFEDLTFQYIINIIYTSGYGLSIGTLLLSVVIFTSFRSLICTRVRVHIHLFIAIILNDFSWILWYKVVVDHPPVVQNNEVWCQILHVVTYFFMLSIYAWMFCEGLHLYKALVVVFNQGEMTMRYYMTLGWGLSLTFILIYVNLRIFVYEQTKRCWMDSCDAFWVIVIPVGLSIVALCTFFVKILWVLVGKTNPVNRNNMAAAKKVIWAALILIPLFGLHFVIIPFQPVPRALGEKLFQIFSAFLTSYQGFAVSILFCFTNGEVIAAVKAQWAKMHRQRIEIFPMTGATVGESAAHIGRREIHEHVV